MRGSTLTSTTSSNGSVGEAPGGIKTTARMLAARDTDLAHTLRSEEEGSEVFDHLRRLKREQPEVG